MKMKHKSVRLEKTMHWADKVAEQVIASGKYKPYWVDDMKTPSGYAHIGSMLGPMVHSAIYRALRDAGHESNLTYVFNDFDVADEFPPNFKDQLSEHAGKVLKMIPSPVVGFDNLADLLSDDLKKSLAYLGFEAKYISSWELYRAGEFDGVIREALDNAEKIQDIYKKISGSDKKQQGWLPLQVICENCQKLGTTKVYDWDGVKVKYRCEANLVTWAKGCGHEGEMSPFGGNAKLPWKIDWAAHWKVIGVTIEGAGKDHASAGGSYDIAMEICKEVFKFPQPFKLPIEFLLIGGRKMSSSRGIGLKAHDLVNILPAEVARFLFIDKDINKQSNFDPNGTMAIPDLFDKYDESWKKKDRSFLLSQITQNVGREFNAPRFRDIANYLSQGLSEKEVTEKFIESNIDDLAERIKYAQIWLKDYAPDEYRFDMKDIKLLDIKLTDVQKKYLGKIKDIYNDRETPESLQISLYELTKEMKINTLDAFKAIYLSFIGKAHGPRAGMLLYNFGRQKVFERIDDVLSMSSESSNIISDNNSDYSEYQISNEVKNLFPEISFAYVVINNVKIKKNNDELETLKEEIISSKKELTTEKINEIVSIKSYREMIRKTGIDFHSRRPSPDALLRRISLGKGLYTINTAVDAYNLAVISTGIGLGGFDFSKIVEPVSLRLSEEGEEVFLLGDDEKSLTQIGELVYADNEKVLTIDLNYRDINETKITEKTKDIILFADGGPNIDPNDVVNALKLGADYIVKFCGGTISDIKLVK